MYKSTILSFVLIATTVLFSCVKETTKNLPPQVNAGPPQHITADSDSVTLAGSATDSDGIVVAYFWSLISGPSAVNIVHPGSPSTAVTGFKNGTYLFQLMATDEKGATGVDTVSITLNRADVKTQEFNLKNNGTEIQFSLYDGSGNRGSGLPDISLVAWTAVGSPYITRHVLKFDLSSIPANAEIKNATLYLYSFPPPLPAGNFTDANYGSDNSFLIRQITSSWDANAISYYTPPATTNTNQVTVPSTTLSKLDLAIDIKDLIQAIKRSNTNFGLCLQLKSEYIYTSRMFVSGNNTTYPEKHPKLIVTYKYQ